MLAYADVCWSFNRCSRVAQGLAPQHARLTGTCDPSGMLGEAWKMGVLGTQFACFTRTKVQINTDAKHLRAGVRAADSVERVVVA